MVRLSVLLFGSLGETVGKRGFGLEFEKNVEILDVIHKIDNEFDQKFRALVLKPESDEILPNVRILINGREYESLEGVHTILVDGDTLVFLPTMGGG